jgi:hypothetical protein
VYCLEHFFHDVFLCMLLKCCYPFEFLKNGDISTVLLLYDCLLLEKGLVLKCPSAIAILSIFPSYLLSDCLPACSRFLTISFIISTPIGTHSTKATRHVCKSTVKKKYLPSSQKRATIFTTYLALLG